MESTKFIIFKMLAIILFKILITSFFNHGSSFYSGTTSKKDLLFYLQWIGLLSFQTCDPLKELSARLQINEVHMISPIMDECKK